MSSSHFIVKILVVLLAYHLSPITSYAQSFTQRIQNTVRGGGTLTIHQDATIEALVNGPHVTTRQQTGQQSQQGQPNRQRSASDDNRQQQAQGAGNNAATASAGNQQTATAGNQQTATAGGQQAADSVSQGTVRTRRVIGYRIQAFVGGKTRVDRQKAEQTGNALRSLFPGQKVYVHFYSPRWICRMGNYRTYEEARNMLDEVIRAGYDSATIVKGRITVPY